MSQASTWIGMSPQLLKVAERAKNEHDGQFHALAHLLDESALFRAFYRQREDAAVGVDGVTKEDYGQHLVDNLQGLHERLVSKRYRHQPIRRVHIPKGKGQTRPLGISAFEDKVVQDALREVLQAVYEQDFLDCSHGFRPGRSAHDAIRALHRAADRGELNWVLEVAHQVLLVVLLGDPIDAYRRVLTLPVERPEQGRLIEQMSQRVELSVGFRFGSLRYLQKLRGHADPGRGLAHVSLLKFVTTRAAFARPGPGCRPVPRRLSSYAALRLPCGIGRDSGFPCPRPTPGTDACSEPAGRASVDARRVGGF